MALFRSFFTLTTILLIVQYAISMEHDDLEMHEKIAQTDIMGARSSDIALTIKERHHPKGHLLDRMRGDIKSMHDKHHDKKHSLRNRPEHHDMERTVMGIIRDDADQTKHHHHKSSTIHGWMDGVTHSAIMIVSMETMDKTFFIQAIMAMTHNKWIILLGSLAALFLMNGISCCMGVVLPFIMSRTVTLVIAAVLFSFFGVKMILQGINMKPDEKGEFEEAQEEIKSNLGVEEVIMETSPLISPKSEKKMCKPTDNMIIQIFVMIFFAEWGDRSQVSTIMLAGTHPVLSVFCGGCVGYFITSLLAVMCGSCLASRVSPRVITISGGVLFVLFAVQTILMK